MANHDEASASGPGGFGIALKGQNIIILIIMSAALAAMIWVQHEDRAKNVKIFDAAVTKFEETLKVMRVEHTALLEACKGGR